MTNLNQEEKELLNSVENDEWHSINNLEQAKLKYQKYAINQNINQETISITLIPEDREKINQLASQLGKSVNHLSQDILHKYLQGILIEIQ